MLLLNQKFAAGRVLVGNLNTSHVAVKLYGLKLDDLNYYNLNTSHVAVKLQL